MDAIKTEARQDGAAVGSLIIETNLLFELNAGQNKRSGKEGEAARRPNAKGEPILRFPGHG